MLCTLLGDLCESTYNGCRSDSACKVNWNNDTICIPKTAADQKSSGQAYSCSGTCSSGYRSSDNFTCNGMYEYVVREDKDLINRIVDINECTENASICDRGQCINEIGTYTCNCTQGYRFNSVTCIGN